MDEQTRPTARQLTIEGVRRYCRRLELAGVPPHRTAEIQEGMLTSLSQNNRRWGLLARAW